VDAYIAGYQAGAKKAVPGITVLNGYSNDLFNASKCSAIAQQQIAAGAG
jgi:basic membrane protein A